jgi:hypothetical protein
MGTLLPARAVAQDSPAEGDRARLELSTTEEFTGTIFQTSDGGLRSLVGIGRRAESWEPLPLPSAGVADVRLRPLWANGWA